MFGLDLVEWYQTHVFDAIPFAPSRPLLWGVLPSAASTANVPFLSSLWRLMQHIIPSSPLNRISSSIMYCPGCPSFSWALGPCPSQWLILCSCTLIVCWVCPLCMCTPLDAGVGFFIVFLFSHTKYKHTHTTTTSPLPDPHAHTFIPNAGIIVCHLALNCTNLFVLNISIIID